MSDIIIINRTIENIKISLFTNGSNNRLQLIEVCNVDNLKFKGSRCIHSSEFLDVVNAIINNKKLSEVIEAVGHTWSAESIKNLINSVVESEGEL